MDGVLLVELDVGPFGVVFYVGVEDDRTRVDVVEELEVVIDAKAKVEETTAVAAPEQAPTNWTGLKWQSRFCNR